MFGSDQGAGTVIHGTEATIFVNRGGCRLIPNGKSKARSRGRRTPHEPMNVPHWKNLLECIRSRQKPISEIETCVRSSTVCLLANLSMRFKIPARLG